MNRSELLQTIQREHSAFEALLASLSETQLCTPALEGQRSPKDVLAHIAGWELLCAGWLEEVIHGQTPHPVENDDQENERLFQENRDRSLHEVQEDAARAYQYLLQQVQDLSQALSEEELNAADRFSWIQGHSLVEIIAGSSSDHYREHAEQIRRWLETTHV